MCLVENIYSLTPIGTPQVRSKYAITKQISIIAQVHNSETSDCNRQGLTLMIDPEIMLLHTETARFGLSD